MKPLRLHLEVAVLPPKSDIVCYTPMDETEPVCALDVRPSVLKTLGPKRHSERSIGCEVTSMSIIIVIILATAIKLV
jgi:hypothetical protein